MSKTVPLVITTCHQSKLMVVDGILCHGSDSIGDDPGPALVDCELVDLPNGSFALRKGSFYATAEPSRCEISFDRRNIGPWEQFVAEPESRDAFLQRSRLQSVPLVDSTCYSLDNTEIFNESYESPRSNTETDSDWYTSHSSTFYPIKPGHLSFRNQVVTTTEKVLSTTYRSHGVVFDEHGFCNHHGFLYLNRSYEQISINPVDSSILADFNKIRSGRNLNGSYLLPFDGNSFNYYHFVVEGLVQLWFLRKAGFQQPPIICTGADGLLPFQQQFLHLLGIETVVLVDGSRCETILPDEVVFLKRNTLPYLPASAIKDMVAAIKTAAGVSERRSGRRLFLTRKPGYARSIVNQAEVQHLLSDMGFEPVDTEGMSATAQIALFADASVVVGPHGAGMANLIFCNPGAAIVDLIPGEGEVRSFFWLLAEKVGVRYYFLRCGCEPEQGYGSQLTANLERLKALVTDLIADQAAREP